MLQKSLGRFIRIAALLTIGLASGGVAQAQKATPAASAVIAGRTVTSIVVLQGGNPAGDLRKVEPTRWVEFDAAGVAVSDYEETKRDDTTVTLMDRSRGVTLVLDMKLNKVNYSDASTRRRELYQITSWDSKPVAEQERVSLVELRREGGAGPMSGRRTDYTPPPPPPPQFCWNERVLDRISTKDDSPSIDPLSTNKPLHQVRRLADAAFRQLHARQLTGQRAQRSSVSRRRPFSQRQRVVQQIHGALPGSCIPQTLRLCQSLKRRRWTRSA